MGDIETASFRSGSDGGTLHVASRGRSAGTLHHACSVAAVRRENGIPVEVQRGVQGAKSTSRTDAAPTAMPTTARASMKPSPERGSRPSRSAACSSR